MTPNLRRAGALFVIIAVARLPVYVMTCTGLRNVVDGTSERQYNLRASMGSVVPGEGIGWVETIKLQSERGTGSTSPGDGALVAGVVLQGRYQMIKVIGRGGMGAVYQVRDMRFKAANRLCALKEMIISTGDLEERRRAAQRFEREASMLATLSHQSIPKIYDYFTQDDRNYLVLEFIDGKDLERVLGMTRAVPLPAQHVVEWAIQVCDVLSYLHHHDPPIVFRDMKPSNIMVRPSNRIVLIDFGIARRVDVGPKGTMIGTEGYSPPEQYRGVASPQGDIYALGATLHHLLTRRDPRLHPPFTFSEEPPSRLNSTVSKELEDVITKALEYEPLARYADADEMKEALIRCQEKGAPASGDALAQRDREQTGQVELAAALRENTSEPKSVVPVAISQGVVPVWRFECEDEVRSSPVVVDGIVYVGCYDGNLHAIEAKTGHSHWKYATEGGVAATPCVWKDRVLVGSEDRVFYAVSARTGRILWTCPTEGRIRSSARVELEHAFFGSDDHRMYAVNANSGQVVWHFEALDAIRASPAVGDEIVYIGSEDSHLYAIDLQTGRQRWKFRANRGILSSPVLCDGLVIFGSGDSNVYALDERSGWSVWRYRAGQAVVSSPRIADGIVYVGSLDGFMYALDASSGRLVWKHNAGSQIASTAAVGHGNVYFGTIGGDVVSLNCRSGKEQWRFTTDGPVPSSPAVVGAVVYVGSNDRRVYALST
jgi:outer membrane protein assembly factor BamB